MVYRRTPQVQARLEAARTQILDATLELVAADGWSAATVAAVARRAEIATGTLYGHFEDKNALFAEAFRRAAGRELEAVSDAAQSARGAVGCIEAALQVFAHRAARKPRLAYALLAEPVGATVEEERLTYRSGYRRLFEGLLSDGVAAGELESHDEGVTAAVLVGAMSEAMIGPLSAVTATAPPPRRHREIDVVVAACLRAVPVRSGTPPDPGAADGSD